jgi:hypothetical protein
VGVVRPDVHRWASDGQVSLAFDYNIGTSVQLPHSTIARVYAPRAMAYLI